MAKIWIRRISRSDWLRTARNNATLGIPAPDAAERDTLETDIEGTFQQAFAQNAKPMIQEADSLAERLNRARTELLEIRRKIETRLPVEHLQERLKADSIATRPVAVAALKDKKHAYSHLTVFRTEHGLTRPAEKRKNAFDVLAVISIFLVAETFINAYFYQTGVGLIAGAAIAFLFSCIIAALGFASGFLGRYRNSQILWERIGGWLAIIVGAVIAIYISSVTATFRALVEITRLSADRQADVSAQSADLFTKAIGDGSQIFFFHVPFHEINATLLFAIAIIAFVNAAIAGYTCIDPVPNYSKASERFDRSDAQCQAAETKLRSDLLSSASEMKLERARIVTSINDSSRIQGDLAIKFERCAQRFAECAEQTNADYKQAVKECRNENVKHRAQGTRAPAYFADDVEDLVIDTEPLLFRNIQTGLDTMKADVTALTPEIPTLNAEIVELEQQRAALAETITQHVKDWDDIATLEIETEDAERFGSAPNRVATAVGSRQ
jgi:hypothetical protein